MTTKQMISKIPFYNEWVAPWAMHRPNFLALEFAYRNLDVTRHLAEVDDTTKAILADTGRYVALQIDGVVVVTMSGTLMKHASSFGDSCSTVGIRQLLNKFKNDDSVRGVILKIESPGGTVSGTKELADDIAKFPKPIMAYCSDLTASAAYWIASQCNSIEANDTALVGSIGTYCVVMDSSGMAAKEGVIVHVVKAGEFKGMGTPGTEVTDRQLESLQRSVDGMNAFFLKAVATGRKMDQGLVEKIADGDVHLAARAKSLGLIDRVSTFEDCFERFAGKVSPPPVATSRLPATNADFDREFGSNADANFRLKCFERVLTIDQSRELFNAEVLPKLQEDEENRSRPGKYACR